MRAVRFVHPDKLPGEVWFPFLMSSLAFSHTDLTVYSDDISLETRMVAEAAFILLTEAFNRYRASAAADGSR